MAEAFRTITVTGQRLLQEPEAVSDDDDDDTVLGETRSEESEEGDESEFELLAKRVIHQVSYSVSTFCRNEIRQELSEVPTAYFHFLSSFRKKLVAPPPPPPPMLDVIFVGNFPQSPPKSS